MVSQNILESNNPAFVQLLQSMAAWWPLWHDSNEAMLLRRKQTNFADTYNYEHEGTPSEIISHTLECIRVKESTP